MRCDRCGYAVPQWLWLGDDHPMIVNSKPAMICRIDNIEDNTMKIVVEDTVAVRMCKDVHPDKVEVQEKLGEAAEKLAEATGLSYRVCIELLDKGWTYQEENHEPGKFISPIANLRNENNEIKN